MSYTEIKIKRARSLVYIARELIKNGILDGENYTLNADIVSELVEHYAQDLSNLKSRYKISGRANSAKVAGLMASAIIRYHPWVPINGKAILNSHDGNETLAIFHGLALCAIQSDGEINHKELRKFVNNPAFEKWLCRFKYLLRNRNHTPESLAFVFDTIGSFVFHCVDLEQEGD
jgi:hypothetical protein